ncbi:hypothetical protein [Nocardiopsis sp. MG754419]|uniref:hypothetical protein n=1 Tax=Nocardiopsis sp. MG754419 TaxID=2259865 RepID=UPI001BAE2145|nr:hypothetical protein [Nocardiopsis sp. MG754419]MBR8744529.1 hypothetical protein [Nocardiopsis sp. MG754419]
MWTQVAQIIIIVLALLCVVAVVVIAWKSRQWRRAHGDPGDVPIIDPELTRFGTPFSPIREEADRLMREGRAADDPATAYVTHRLATRAAAEPNPWEGRGFLGVALIWVLYWAFSAVSWDRDTSLPFGFLFLPLFLVTVTALAGVAAARRDRRLRERVERAVELNRDLAAAYASERDRGETGTTSSPAPAERGEGA